MKFIVSENTLNSTTKCKESFSCLYGSKECLCDIEDCAGEKVHFIKPRNNVAICEYRMAFGYAFTCNCPIRKELYNHYRI
jgi:hypothetical protein